MGAILGLGVTHVPHAATATVLYAHDLGLVPITTPAYSPESKLFAVSGTLGSTPARPFGHDSTMNLEDAAGGRVQLPTAGRL